MVFGKLCTASEAPRRRESSFQTRLICRGPDARAWSGFDRPPYVVKQCSTGVGWEECAEGCRSIPDTRAGKPPQRRAITSCARPADKRAHVAALFIARLYTSASHCAQTRRNLASAAA